LKYTGIIITYLGQKIYYLPQRKEGLAILVRLNDAVPGAAPLSQKSRSTLDEGVSLLQFRYNQLRSRGHRSAENWLGLRVV
jgi:hypothetical protein